MVFHDCVTKSNKTQRMKAAMKRARQERNQKEVGSQTRGTQQEVRRGQGRDLILVDNCLDSVPNPSLGEGRGVGG